MSTGKFAVDIGGEAVTIPGVYTVPDKSAMVAPRGIPARSMAIVAPSKGGRLGTVTRVLRGDEARLLRGGLAAQMARAAFNHGAKEVLVVRADRAEPAVLNLGVGYAIAVNPGQGSNAYQGKTIPNPKRADAVDVYFKDASGAEQDEAYRMLGPLVDFVYVGTGTDSRVAVFEELDGSVTVRLTASGDASGNLEITSNAVPTLSEFVEAVNRSASWSARAIGHPGLPLRVSDSQEVSTVSLGGQQRATIYGTAKLLELALVESRIAQFAPNTGEIGVMLVSAAPSIRITGAYEFFQGGSDGPVPTPEDYINAFRILENVPVTGIAVGSDSPVVASILASHLTAMSGVKARQERYGALGQSPTPTKTDFLNNVTALAEMFSDVDLMCVTGNIPVDYDIQTNALQEQHGAVAAAAVIAMKVIGRPEEPLTNKRVRFPKLRYAFTTEELEDLIEAGVMPIAYDLEQKATVVTAGITTYTVDANVASRKLAAVDSIQYLNKKIRQRINTLSVGKIPDEARLKAILQSIEGLLKEEVRGSRNPNGILTPGIDLSSGQPVAAYRNLTAVYDGFDLVGVDFDANLVGEIAFVRVRPRFTPVRVEARQ